MKKPELLAPAGDLNRAKTAIRYGADAVYLGGQFFSLRSRASNFSMEDIREICLYARNHHANIHVTVNMIPHDDDFEGLEEYLKELEEDGVTAIITASPAVMTTARTAAGRLEIHASTQLSLTNLPAIQYLYQSLHIDRAVLARECTIQDVYSICRNSPVEIEAFIHGGMCVNYSGRCTLSNRMTLRDANRGGCAQSCRWQYHLFDGGQEISRNALFTMGSKDLCAADSVYDLMAAGVSSLKIEGRMKTEYYVASIVSAYRHLIDEIYDKGAPLSEERMKYHRNEILKGENRETWGGFYDNPTGRHSLIYTANSNNQVNHDFLAVVKDYDVAAGICTAEVRNVFASGEVIEALVPGECNRHFKAVDIMDEKTGAYLDDVRQPMRLVRFKVPFLLHRDDILRRYRPC